MRFRQGVSFSSPRQSPWHDSSTAEIDNDADDIGSGKLSGITPSLLGISLRGTIHALSLICVPFVVLYHHRLRSSVIQPQ